ncbi:AP-4 complex accessory subunit RUSC2 isoform X3 [Vidua chalybeata]|uniref:AP-4 complex accessory subunit RUSC2 isoform X3 n=1 Tax=Vidua chalybeata TaxID=81927 RepID=UPI0023A88FBE|nr:AP-4 complex accessory subunit RUSC2 isoform X3 [Vidua chalybeata]
MDSPPKLTGETLIVHHIPLVHCQIPDRQCCSMSKRTNPFCQPDLSISRTSALPDRDLSQTDSLVYSSFLQTSETSAETSDHKERKARDLIVPSVSKRHNPFLLSEGEDLNIFGDDLGQKSFHLHNSLVDGKPPFNLQDLALPPFHLHDSKHIVKSWNMASRSGVVDGQEDKLSSDDIQKRNNANRCHQASERMELDECSCHRGSSSNFSFDSGDQEWNQNMGESLRNQDALHRTCSCSSSEIQHCHCYSSSSQSEVIDQQMGYISDSSCNSSDGVLVNFSALYNKMNGQPQSNLNSANLSCDSSFCSHSDTGAFYLDLHSSPTESKMSCESHNPESSGKVCGCQHSSSPVLDANCNSYHLHCEPCTSESSDLTACFQSQARLVVATQNYYKLVTCDLSSQSSPSPVGSSITSCSEDQTKGSPAQPTEYYLFRRPDLRQEGNVECSEEEPKGESSQNMIEGQVYVNVSPPNLNTSRQRSRSYDQNLDRSPGSRLGSLERMVSCPVKLSESPAIPIQSSPPKRVTSFAELAKGRKKNSTSPPHRSSGDSSLEFSPIPETQQDCPTFLEERARRSQSLPPMPFIHGLNRSCEGFCLNHAFGDSQALCSTKDSISSEKVPSGHGAGQSMRQLQLTYNDFFPDYFSLAEKPPAEFCLSPDGNTESISIDLLQKKGLVKAINTAVDLIVAHFGTSRDPGVKAKLGNSSVSPNVGHLILKYLCPAVRDILSDGLKAYVLDMIIGQRRNIPWSVVEASTQLGPSTKLLHSLYSKISQYTELTNHTMRFNAFIFGLLNIQSLEFWFNHLYNHEDIILAHYQPVGFLCLSHSVCQPLFEELLLLLQPLSLLPFNLDLLFEHHLMQMGKEQQQQKELLRVKQDLLLSVHSTLQLMQTRGSSEDPDGCSTAPETCQGGARDGDISPGLSPQQAVSEKRVKGVGASCGEGDREEEQSKMRESTWEGKKDKQAGWWYQLMQTSQIYIESSAEGSKFIRSEKKKAALNPAPRSVETRKAPPPREGVVEGAEACPIAEGTLDERPKAASKPSPEAMKEPLEKPQQVVVGEEVKERSWPFWMGSPPDSVLTELKHSKEKEAQQRVGAAAAPQEDSSTNASEGSQSIKWGHLFGSRKVQKEPRQPNRLPSGWLSLDKSVFQLVAQTVGASMCREAAPEPDPPHPEPSEASAVARPARGMSPHPTCEVKALCHHIATESGQLSFNKGDILHVISKVDGDWLQCSLGSKKGLVPIMYVTHPQDEDY